VKRLDAAKGGAAVLFVLYALTLAPGVTFWDAGEFIAAAHSLGIPHPPGTPLFILIVNVWAKVLFFLPYAVATNLFSAAATACAAFVSARLVHRATRNGSMTVAAAIAAGAMSSVWLNATETEVYAASLVLGMLTIWAGERAGREEGEGERWTYLTAYLMALSVPLHLSALVAAPAAIALASQTATGGGIRWRRAVLLAGTFVMAMGAGRMSMWITAAGAVLMTTAIAMPDPALNAARRMRVSAGVLGVALIGISALLFLYIRARFDPGINQGNPETLTALADVVARRQYAVSPMWPREAPVWVQLANFGQYADWQAALSLGPTVLPSILRTLGTVLFLLLGYEGAITLWRMDRRIATGMLALFASGALGVLAYLNLHAGPSIGYGILPDNTVREARERDYFFVFAFWVWGIWAGIGAVSLAARFSRPPWAGVLVACLPIALNWRAVTRRGEPEQSLPLAVAEALLESSPQNAVLFVVGDNDSYPLWYAQQALHKRPDVVVVTVPLLPTRWYRSELSRRHFLLTDREVERFDGKLPSAAALAAGARRLGRPVVAATTLTADEREKLGKGWVAQGVVYAERSDRSSVGHIDTVAVKRWSDWVAARVPSRSTRPAIDPVNVYYRALLDCPRQLLERARKAESNRLDSVCNYR
jgi:hypothetical protein